MHLCGPANKQLSQQVIEKRKSYFQDETKRKIIENNSLQTERQIQTHRQSLLGQA